MVLFYHCTISFSIRKPRIYSLSTNPARRAIMDAANGMGQEEVQMEQRERIIRRWFDMWLEAKDRGIADIFAPDCVYTESWGPEYHGAAQVKHWFDEWNTRGRVLVWDIKQFFHQNDQTAVEWYFKNRMQDGRVEEFDGISLIRWTADGKIASLKEFGCNIHTYDPYADGPVPRFRDEKAGWF